MSVSDRGYHPTNTRGAMLPARSVNPSTKTFSLLALGPFSTRIENCFSGKSKNIYYYIVETTLKNTNSPIESIQTSDKPNPNGL